MKKNTVFGIGFAMALSVTAHAADVSSCKGYRGTYPVEYQLCMAEKGYDSTADILAHLYSFDCNKVNVNDAAKSRCWTKRSTEIKTYSDRLSTELKDAKSAASDAKSKEAVANEHAKRLDGKRDDLQRELEKKDAQIAANLAEIVRLSNSCSSSTPKTSTQTAAR